jgi:hypothetical protein
MDSNFTRTTTDSSDTGSPNGPRRHRNPDTSKDDRARRCDTGARSSTNTNAAPPSRAARPRRTPSPSPNPAAHPPGRRGRNRPTATAPPRTTPLPGPEAGTAAPLPASPPSTHPPPPPPRPPRPPAPRRRHRAAGRRSTAVAPHPAARASPAPGQTPRRQRRVQPPDPRRHRARRSRPHRLRVRKPTLQLPAQLQDFGGHGGHFPSLRYLFGACSIPRTNTEVKRNGPPSALPHATTSHVPTTPKRPRQYGCSDPTPNANTAVPNVSLDSVWLGRLSLPP